jgi:hypothetical protein
VCSGAQDHYQAILSLSITNWQNKNKKHRKGSLFLKLKKYDILFVKGDAVMVMGWERRNKSEIPFYSVSRSRVRLASECCTQTAREGNMLCHAVSMPRHARHGHATPQEQKFEIERKKRSKGQRAIHSFIHFTYQVASASQFPPMGRCI